MFISCTGKHDSWGKIESMSLTYILNKRGLKPSPCRTPFPNLDGSVIVLSFLQQILHYYTYGEVIGKNVLLLQVLKVFQIIHHAKLNQMPWKNLQNRHISVFCF